MSDHKLFRRSRHARLAQPHAYDTPSEGDLFDRAMMPRFSPTAVWTTTTTSSESCFLGVCGSSSTSSAAAATPTSHSAVAPTTPTPAPEPTTSSSPTPVAAPTTSSTTSSTSTSTTPTSTSTSTSSSSSSIPTSTFTSTTPSSISTSAVPILTPTSTPVPSVVSVPATSVAMPSVTTPSLTTTVPGLVASSATPSASSTTAASGGTSTSVVVGGIVGGLVGCAGLIFAIMYIMRRYRKDEDDTDFNADDFRRQSAILIDDDTAFGSGNKRGARPPTMIERHMAGANTFDAPAPMPSLQDYGNDMAGTGVGGYGGDYDYPNDYPSGPSALTRQPSFSPGQIVSPTSPPPVHGGAYNAYNDPAQLSRQPSSAGVLYDQYGQLVRQPSNAGYADLARQPFNVGYPNLNRQPSNVGYPDLSRQNSLGGGPAAHYVDLDRSSVTPFQAQQYAEISKRLNVETPAGLNVVNEDEEPNSHAPDAFDQSERFENPHAEPFDDDSRGDSIDAFPNPFGQEEIAPPSPVYSMNPNTSISSSRDRIVSQPPTLPEINVPAERAFSPTSYDFPQTPSIRPSPSPLHNGFTVPSSPPAEQGFPKGLTTENAPTSTPAAATVPGSAERVEKQRPPSTYTVYDEEDAYGGF